jgi:hypothetical protein
VSGSSFGFCSIAIVWVGTTIFGGRRRLPIGDELSKLCSRTRPGPRQPLRRPSRRRAVLQSPDVRAGRAGGDRETTGESLRQLLDQFVLGDPGGRQSLERFASLPFGVFVLGRVDGVVGPPGLVPLHALLDHLVDGQLFHRDDLAEVANAVLRDDVVPRCEPALEQPVIRRADRGGLVVRRQLVEQLAVVAARLLRLFAWLDQNGPAAAVVMDRDRPLAILRWY